METDLHSKSRNELREALRRKGLSPSGVKEDLIKRLEGFGGSIQSNSFISSGLNSNAFVLSTRKQMDANESHRSTDDEQPSPQPHHLQSTQQSIQQQQQPVNNVLQTQLLVAEQSAINHQEQLINATRAILSDESPICGHPNKYGKKKHKQKLFNRMSSFFRSFAIFFFFYSLKFSPNGQSNGMHQLEFNFHNALECPFLFFLFYSFFALLHFPSR